MNATPTPVPEELAPEIIREGWSEYTLEDGVKLRVRVVVTKIIWQGPRPPPPGATVPFGLGVIPVIVAFTPPNLKGLTGRGNPSDSQVQAARKHPVKIRDATEPWNLYTVPGLPGALKIRLSVTSVQRAEDLYNNEGDPVYQIVHSSAGSFITEEELKVELS